MLKTKTSIEPIITSVFKYWYGKNDAKLKQLKGTPNWKKLKDDVDGKKFGEYYDSGLTGKYVFIALPEMEGKELWEVAEYVNEKYADRLPGFEAFQEGFEGRIADKESWIYHFCFGASLRLRYGYWIVPYFHWYVDTWNRRAAWLGNTWHSHYRVVLLEIADGSDSLASPESDPLDLELALKMVKEAGYVIYKPV